MLIFTLFLPAKTKIISINLIDTPYLISLKKKKFATVNMCLSKINK